jgi:hypothetical protein
MRRTKLVITALAVMGALMAVAAVPAMANSWNNCDWNNGWNNCGFHHHGFFGHNNNVRDVVQAPTETFVSGSNVNNAGSVQGGGDNSNTCAAQENFNNSGGVLNQPSFQQVDNTRFNDGRFFDHRGRFFDDGRRFFGDGFFGGGTTFFGPSFVNAPSQSASCNPSVQQSASSSSG